MNFKIVAHTHWDREWYFSHYKSRVYSYVIFDEIIDFLKENLDFKCFLLDGQTSIIEEYLSFHPDKESDLFKLVKDRRLMIGPWYSQTDTLVISGESIVRNLLYGTKYANMLGHSMDIGYLPDSFGMSWQMPQIYQGFDIRFTMFRRGIADSMSKDREFYWESPDESKVFCHNIYHYGTMAYPPETVEDLQGYMTDMVSLLSESSKTGNIVLFNGEDQKPIRKNLVEIVNKMNIIGEKEGIRTQIVNPEDLMVELESSDYEFESYCGEMTFGQHSRTHKSIFSTRYDLKQKNNYIENYMTNIFEPLMTISHILGLEYEKNSVDYIWKKILDNAAHDSAGMCNSDLTNSFIENRFDDAKEFSLNLVELKLRQIANRIEDKNIFQFQIYNLLPYKRSRIEKIRIYVPSKNFKLIDDKGTYIDYCILDIEDVTEKIFKLSKRETGVAGNISPRWVKECTEIYIADLLIKVGDIPALGYETINVEEAKQANALMSPDVVNTEYIENEFVKISIVNDDIWISDKRNMQKYKLFFEDSGDEGDSYDYSEPSNDYKISEIDICNYEINQDSFYKYLCLNFSMLIPENLEKRELREFNKLLEGKLDIILDDSDLIKVKIGFNNPALEHRFRLVIKSDIESKISIADQQFGTIERPTQLNYPNWREEGFNEKPRTIEPMMSYCAIQDDSHTLQILTDDVREYQVIGHNLDSLAMTIFRSTTHLGKKDLNDRPGRESGNTSETFDTRFLGEYVESEYYIKLYDNRADYYKMSKVSKDLFTPFIYYQGAEFKNNTEHLVLNNDIRKDIPRSFSLFEVGDDVVLSTLKKAEDGNDIILRLYNPSYQIVEANKGIAYNQNYLGVDIKEVKLNETSLVSTTNYYKPCQVKTFRLNLR